MILNKIIGFLASGFLIVSALPQAANAYGYHQYRAEREARDAGCSPNGAVLIDNDGRIEVYAISCFSPMGRTFIIGCNNRGCAILDVIRN